MTTYVYGKYDLAICAIFQDEAPFLKEWIEFHKLQGVQHFYLYNNNSEDDYQSVLQPYLDDNQVTLVQWPYTYAPHEHAHWIQIQTKAYTSCLYTYGYDITWCAVIDIDEFLFCPNGEKLTHFLKDFKDFGGVSVNWVKFGTSQVEEIPPHTLMIELLTHCIEKPGNIEDYYTKCIVQPKCVESCYRPHFFVYKKGFFAVDTDKQRLPDNRSISSSRILLDKLRINHYWTRTEKHLREKKIKSRLKRRQVHYTPRLSNLIDRYNDGTDLSIQQFVPQLRRRMGFDS